ncbi:MAG: DNA polymerase IV [Clostridia bacterium]|nr:DNA polymerase IV [Clostridia bacterium]
MKRIILHCDLNNFYASVECMKDPTLWSVPLAVCGSREERRGIVLAKNEKAKAFGVKTGEAVWEAKKKCPALVTVPPDMRSYVFWSKEVKHIYENYTDIVEPFGIDECWLDMSGSAHLFGGGTRAAYMIKEEVKARTGLTISCGVSFNKVFAKLGSDLKKPDAVTVIAPEDWENTVYPLPASALMGVGRSTYNKLSSRGIFTIGDIARSGEAFMRSLLGKNGLWLLRAARGLDAARVISGEYMPRPKSIGRGATYPHDIIKPSEIRALLLKLSHEVARKLRAEHFFAGAVQLEIKRTDFSKHEYSVQLKFFTQTAYDIWKCALELFFMRHDIMAFPVRALSVRACDLREENAPRQLSLFDDAKLMQKHERAERAMDIINGKYGKNTIQVASCKFDPVRI